MAITLKDLLGTVLSDVVRAQHESNMRIQRLSDQYAQGGKLSGIPLPSATIGDLTLSLEYAVAGGVVKEEEKGVNEKGVDKVLRYVCNEVSELLIKTMVSCIQDSHADYSVRYAFVDTLPNNNDFLRHIRRRFYALVSEDTGAVLDHEGTLQEEKLSAILLPAAIEYLIDHEDIRGLFRQEDAEGLRDTIIQEFDRVLQKELDDILRESKMKSFHHIQRYGSLNIEIGDEMLSQLPPERVHTLSITINPATNDIHIKDNK